MKWLFKNIAPHQVELLYRSSPLTILAAVISASILAAVLWPVIDHTVIVVWLVVTLLIAAGRGVLTYKYLHIAKETSNLTRWTSYFAWASYLAASGWGIATVALFPHSDILRQAFLAFIVAGTAAGSVSSLSVVSGINVAYLGLMLVPLSIRLLTTTDPIIMMMGGLTLVFFLYLVSSSRRIANNITEVAQAHTEAVERGKKLAGFKKTLDMTHDCVFMFEPGSLKFFYVNEGATNQVGYSSDEMMNMTPIDIKPLISEEEFRRMIAPMLEGKNDSMSFETVHKHKDGSLVTVDIFLQYIAPAGESPRFVAIVRDITKHKEMSEALQSYASTLNRLIDITSSQELEFGKKIHHILQLGLEVFGLSIGIVSHIKGGEYRVEYVDGPEGAPSVGSTYKFNETYCVHTYAANGPKGFHHVGQSEIRNHPCYKSFKQESYLGAPIVVGGECYGTLNFSSPEPRDKAFDVNELLLIQLCAEWIGHELSRQENEVRIKAIVETVADGIITINDCGLIESANLAAEKIFGYYASELIGQNITILMPEPYYQNHDQYIANYLSNGKRKLNSAYREVQGRRRDGTVFPLELAISEMRIGDQRMFSGVLRDISKRKEAEEALQKTQADLIAANARLQTLSLEDGLTGIANRRNFDLTFSKAFREARRNKHTISLIICDIDYFKNFNDTYGHDAGDDCLKQIAQCINQIPNRPHDLVARYGGEEIAIILPATDIKGAKVVAETIREAVWDLSIPHSSSPTENRVTLSLGVASAIPNKACTTDELIRHADEALYRAKHEGRNKARFADSLQIAS